MHKCHNYVQNIIKKYNLIIEPLPREPKSGVRLETTLDRIVINNTELYGIPYDTVSHIEVIIRNDYDEKSYVIIHKHIPPFGKYLYRVWIALNKKLRDISLKTEDGTFMNYIPKKYNKNLYDELSKDIKGIELLDSYPTIRDIGEIK